MDHEKPIGYERPMVIDYGELSKLTAGLHSGPSTDAAFPPHTPKSKLTFS